MASVWAAKSQTERERSQAAFNEFLRFWAKTETTITKEAEERDFEQQFTDDELATKTLFFMAGYALPFLTDAIAGIEVLSKKDWAESKRHFITTNIGYPKNKVPDKDSEIANKRDQTVRELETVKALAKDADAGVRAAVQEYLTSFVDQSAGAEAVAEAINDPDPTVRTNALNALLRSPEPPSLQVVNRASRRRRATPLSA